MEEDRIENNFGKMLEQFRAQNSEAAENSGSSVGNAAIAAQEAGAENIEIEKPTAKAENLTDDEEEEINAEWMELLSGMYFQKALYYVTNARLVIN